MARRRETVVDGSGSAPLRKTRKGAHQTAQAPSGAAPPSPTSRPRGRPPKGNTAATERLEIRLTADRAERYERVLGGERTTVAIAALDAECDRREGVRPARTAAPARARPSR